MRIGPSEAPSTKVAEGPEIARRETQGSNARCGRLAAASGTTPRPRRQPRATEAIRVAARRATAGMRQAQPQGHTRRATSATSTAAIASIGGIGVSLLAPGTSKDHRATASPPAAFATSTATLCFPDVSVVVGT